ncbi:MAG TPA: FtsX-like permease family protein [Acidimicrobiales bacterium]|nr:FtsX-like permease family protein [Acidimicrobiales bacterium]
MWHATFKSLLAHKLRLALTALSVVLGVAFMAGTFVLTDTIKHTFDALFAQTSVGKDVVVRAVAPYGTGGRDSGAGGVRPLTPDSFLATVRSVPGVAAADGSVQGLATVIDKNGKALKKQAPTLLFNWLPERQLSSLSLRSGRGPENSTEFTIDSGTAKSKHFHLGDKVTVITNEPPQQFTLVGITGFGRADNLAGATIVTFDTVTAQRLVGKPGYFEEIDVAAVKGTPVNPLIQAIATKVPQGFEAVSGAAVAKETANQVEQFVGFFNTFLLVFAGIALFVGAFLIFNTFSILVGQRTRELALLRAIGASRTQVNLSVLAEALLVGLFGSVLGLIIGVPLAAGLYGLLGALGVSLPSSALQLLPRTIIVSLITGTVVTLVSAILPAFQASKIPPVAAMREDFAQTPTSLHRRAVAGISVLAVGVLLLAGGLFAKAGIAAVGAGAAITFIGVAILAPFVASPLARVIGAPLPAITGQMAKENAARNPRRTAATASALMVGLALVAAIATLGSSALASFNGIFNRAITADYVLVSANGGGGPGSGFSPAIETAVKSAPGVIGVSPLRTVSWHEGRTSRFVSGIDPVAGPEVFKLDMVTGTTGALAQSQLLVDNKVAKSHHLKVGDTVQMGFAATGIKPVVVGGTFKTNQFVGNYVVSSQIIADNVNQVLDDALFLKTASHSPDATAALINAARIYPNVNVKTAAQFKQDQKKQLNTVLAIVYVLLLLSIIIALIGVVNTLALSVIERTREIGLLRAIGTQRRQIKRMIRGEAVVVSLIGAVLGLVLGVALGAAVVSAISSSGIDTLAIPVSTIVIVVLFTLVFGVVAAVWPARRAAKLDVLQAIATA